MANLYITHGGLPGGTYGTINTGSTNPPQPSGKKFHAGYYYAINYSDVKNLSAAITATATSIPVSTTSIYTGNVIWIDNERITYTGKTATNFTGCVRGTNGTAAVSHANGAAVKMHKYITKYPSDYTNLLNEMNTHSSLRGGLIRYSWREIETAQNVYDFAIMDDIFADFKALSNGPKRMCFMLEIRTGGGEHLVPDYVIANAGALGAEWQHSGGQSGNVIGGYQMRLWNPYVVTRLKALMQAMVDHYDADPYFEMFQVAETAMSNPITGQTPALPANYLTTYFAGLQEATLYFNSASTNTIVTQLVNYPKAQIKTLIPALAAAGVGLGCPNLLADEAGLIDTSATPGVYSYFNTWKNQVPICPAIQRPEMFYSNLTWYLPNWTTGINPNTGAVPTGGVVPNPTFKVITDFAKTVSMQSNYIFVTRAMFADGTSNITGNEFKDDFMTFLNLPAQSSTVTGGLNTTAPSKYASVITT